MDGAKCIFCNDYTRMEEWQEEGAIKMGTPKDWIIVESDYDGKNDLCICSECISDFKKAAKACFDQLGGGK